MTRRIRSSYLMLGAAALLASGCTAADSVQTVQAETPAQKEEVAMATIKPGAALQFSSEIDGMLAAGSYTDVIVTITPDYASGRLQATATGTDGLDVLSSAARLDHDMADGPVRWRIPVRPADDGLRYLNIMATVSPDASGDLSARSFAVAIDPGGKSEMADNPNKAAIMEAPSGERLAVMDADETISGQDE